MRDKFHADPSPRRSSRRGFSRAEIGAAGAAAWSIVGLACAALISRAAYAIAFPVDADGFLGGASFHVHFFISAPILFFLAGAAFWISANRSLARAAFGAVLEEPRERSLRAKAFAARACAVLLFIAGTYSLLLGGEILASSLKTPTFQGSKP